VRKPADLVDLCVKYSHAHMMVNGSSGEGIHNVMTVRVMLAQARAPFADCNGREKAVSGGKGGDGDEFEMSKLHCINAEQANTIAQLRRAQDPAKSQRRAGWKGQKRGPDEQPQAIQEATWGKRCQPHLYWLKSMDVIACRPLSSNSRK
jgi:hypothetical protein